VGEGAVSVEARDRRRAHRGEICPDDAMVTSTASVERPLDAASRRLRRRPGRPRRLLAGPNTGPGIQSAPLEAAKDAGRTGDFATALLPHGLPLPAAAAYSGVPVRALWRLIAAGKLAPVRVPGCRRVLLLREQLDALLDTSVIRPVEVVSGAR
jgi:hypothetical protein